MRAPPSPLPPSRPPAAHPPPSATYTPSPPSVKTGVTLVREVPTLPTGVTPVVRELIPAPPPRPFPTPTHHHRHTRTTTFLHYPRSTARAWERGSASHLSLGPRCEVGAEEVLYDCSTMRILVVRSICCLRQLRHCSCVCSSLGKG